MKLLEFTTDDGKKVWIQRDMICAVEKDVGTRTRILVPGQIYIVRGYHTLIRKRIEQ